MRHQYKFIGLILAGLFGHPPAADAGPNFWPTVEAGHRHVVIEVVLCDPRCAPTTLRVWDGDTLRLGLGSSAERVRLVGIDAPEIAGACPFEIDLAQKAQRRLAALLDRHEVTVLRQGHDVYGRTLASLSVQGTDIGQTLLDEGLAQLWHGRRAQWCGASTVGNGP